MLRFSIKRKRKTALNQSSSGRITPFWGDVNTLKAECFVKSEDERVKIVSAILSGPFCAIAHTLPARYPLCALDDKISQTFKVFLPDPCFWEPGSPFTYQLDLEICEEGRSALCESLMVGIQPLSIRGPDLYYADRRFVMRMVDLPRAVENSESEEDILAPCLHSGSVLMVHDPAPSILTQATRQGILMAVELESTDPSGVLVELTRLALWPAVGMVILPAGLAMDTPLPPPASSLLRSVVYRPDKPIPPWAQVLIVDEALLSDASLQAANYPIMVCCRVDSDASIDGARRVCDDLQQRTAASPAIAGYISSSQKGLY